jgi:sterol 3beta-glucosyltransferase
MNKSHITIVAFGSRGDVQPYVTLGLGLQAAGHAVCMAASDDFAAFIQEHGLEFRPLGLNMRELMNNEAVRVALETGRNILGAMWQVMGSLEATLSTMMERTWQACQGTDRIVFSTVGLNAYHIAEKLGVPCYWALTMPVMNRTRAWASPLLPLPFSFGGGYNRLTHVLVEHFWQQSVGRFFNKWRREHLHLPPIPLYKWPYTHLAGQPLTCLYHYSPAVVPKPPDWSEHIHVSGYLFLDHPPDWQPPAELTRYIESGPPPVYVGFGSMNTRDPEKTTHLVLEALNRAEQRGVLLTGWGGMGKTRLPENVFAVESIPHTWLFPRMAAVVHHGGAGTTGIGLRAGIPNLLVPFAGDQFFWGRRVQALGVGPQPIPRSKLTADKLAGALHAAIHDKPMRARASALGETIRAEGGLARAVEIITGV